MRLIDADKLYPDCFTRSGKLAFSQSQIAEAPTVEREPFATVTFDKDELDRIVDERVIEPIKNGELVIKEERPTGHWVNGYKSFNCSVCGKIAYSWNHFGEYIQVKSNFCPNCGADMRGDKE